MLKNPILVYAIETTKNEWNSSIDDVYDTFDEAMKNIYKYEDWYCSKGTCTIKLLQIGGKGGLYETIKTYRVWEGKVVEER